MKLPVSYLQGLDPVKNEKYALLLSLPMVWKIPKCFRKTEQRRISS
jgi:hypothetical protein